ncbi:PREDICTED: uncharacterized protein LOC108380236 [Rhagoletis zephyria]|uniref:uncharacterized protein LOC108380236 n=1 Tax=Rhagoletis zephyria TaxID=28612 RepID=UPI0008118E61|nr:PREDICTED: uncharacterized protein LOC108380236 [Rhagoletis zephyria]
MATLDAIQKRQEEVFAKLNSVETRQLEMGETINQMQGALSEKMPERSEIQAQSKLLRECRVLTARVQQSVSRITGDVETEESTDLASMLPMSSVEKVQAAEAKLKTKAYADAMMGLLARQKGTKGTVDGVMRGLFTDETVAHFNLEGRAGKIPLVGLKVVDLLFDIFLEKSKEEVRAALKKYISLSHNRHNQKKYITKKSLSNNVE